MQTFGSFRATSLRQPIHALRLLSVPRCKTSA